jgi:hypothetical protein
MNFYLFNFVGNSATNWISTGLSFVSILIPGGIAWFVCDYTYKRWINDVYAKKEAEYWLKYREKFFKLTLDFVKIVKFIQKNNHYNGYYNQKDDFKKEEEKFLELKNLHIFMKPYFDSTNKLKYWDIFSLIENIQGIYFEASSNISCTQTNRGVWEIDNIEDVKSSLIFKMLIQYQSDLNLIKKEQFNEILSNDSSQENMTKIVNLLETNINKINEELEKIILQHKK